MSQSRKELHKAPHCSIACPSSKFVCLVPPADLAPAFLFPPSDWEKLLRKDLTPHICYVVPGKFGRDRHKLSDKGRTFNVLWLYSRYQQTVKLGREQARLREKRGIEIIIVLTKSYLSQSSGLAFFLFAAECGDELHIQSNNENCRSKKRLIQHACHSTVW